MTVVSFTGYTPPARFDDLPWTLARLEQSATQDGVYVTTEAFDLSENGDGVDEDPAHPQTRAFTSTLGTVGLWYRFIWVDDDLNESPPTTPGENTAGSVIAGVTAYVTAAELAPIIHVNATTKADALDRVILAASGEIVSECGRSDFTGWELSLVEAITLEVAGELWEQAQSQFGLVVLEQAFVSRTARDVFARHAQELAPLKNWAQAGIA